MSENSAAILITGASGGFGLEFARQLEPDGYRLILHGRDLPRLQMTLDSLKHPERHRIVTADLTMKSGIDDLLESISEENLVGLINNAGFGIWGDFKGTDIVTQIDVIKTDLKAPVQLTHALLPSLLKHNSNAFIINVSSLAGESPLPFMSTYGAAKAGLTFWSEALRSELDGQIRIVTLAPGPSRTSFRDVSGLPKGPGSFFRTETPVVISSALRTLESGGGFCVPGWRHKLMHTMQSLAPRSVALKLMKKHLKP